MNAQHGQSTVELTALLPLLVLLALGAYAVLAAQTAHEQAGAAAEAGAIALLQDRDARAAARDALPNEAERHGIRPSAGPRPRGSPHGARDRRRRPGADAVSPSALRARAASYFIAPKPPQAAPTGDLIPLVHREPPPRGGAAPTVDDQAAALAPDDVISPDRAAPPDRARPRVDAFLAPAHDDRAHGAPALSMATPPGRFAPRAAVLGPVAGAVPAAAALALSLRASHGGAAAVVATWTPERGGAPSPRGPAAPAAARTAARLTARGLRCTAHGRLAWLPLDDHVVAAAVGARRAAAALDVPLVLALAGPRCDVVEGLLAEQDLVLVVAADPDGPMARLAAANCPCAATAALPPCGVRRALALAGLGGKALDPQSR